MPHPRTTRAVLPLAAAVCLGACSLPRVPFLSGYYQVTDPATGTVWCSDRIKRESGRVVEFQDGRTGAWVSIPGATVVETSAAEYRACLAR